MNRALKRWALLIVMLLGVCLAVGIPSANAWVDSNPKAFGDVYCSCNIIDAPGWQQNSPTGNTKVVFQGDGNLVDYTWLGGTQQRWAVVWASNTAGIGANPTLRFQADNNVAIYDAAGHARWSTGTNANWPYNYRFVLRDPGAYGLLVQRKCIVNSVFTWCTVWQRAN